MKLIVATKNVNKIGELKVMLCDLKIEILSLIDYPGLSDVVEDGRSFEENALKKARAAQAFTGEWVLADDSGLKVDVLGGAPGIYSSRYAGKERDYQANNIKLLKEMEGVPDGKRGAHFVCVMALVGQGGKKYVVQGRCDGEITRAMRGQHGFGYDPLFWVPEKGCTMAELSMEEKNTISHRGRALAQIKQVLLDILRGRG